MRLEEAHQDIKSPGQHLPTQHTADLRLVEAWPTVDPQAAVAQTPQAARWFWLLLGAIHMALSVVAGLKVSTTQRVVGMETTRCLPEYEAKVKERNDRSPKMVVRYCTMVRSRRQITSYSPLLTIPVARAMYMYQAAIPEELSFAKGDILAVTRHQDDGWWEAEVTGKPGVLGLVPSNYLKAC